MSEYQFEHGTYKPVRFADREILVRPEMTQLESIFSRIQTGSRSLQATDWHMLALSLVRNTLFWIRVILRIDHAAILDVSCQRLARAMFSRDPDKVTMSPRRICEVFGRDVSDFKNECFDGGLLFSVWRHERLEQLAETVGAVEMVCLYDFRRLHEGVSAMSYTGVATSNQKRVWASFRERTREMVVCFYDHVLPMAFSALWIWKLYLRKQDLIEEDRSETAILWRGLLQLFALIESPFERSLERVSPASLSSIFHDDIGQTASLVSSTRILDMSLLELRKTWMALLRRTPGLVPGLCDFPLCVRAIIVRMAILASSAQVQTILNDAAFTRVVDSTIDDEVLFVVNDEFMYETERIGYYLLEAVWTSTYLSQTTTDLLEDDIHAISEEHDIPARWNDFIVEMLFTRGSLFVDEYLGEDGWWRYIFWDETERYRKRMKTSQIGPRHVIGANRRHHTDVVSTTIQGKLTTRQLFDIATKNRDIDTAKRKECLCMHRDAGWTYKLLWDYAKEAADHKKNQGTGVSIVNGDRVRRFVDPISEEVTYMDDRTGRVIIGDRLRSIQMSQGVEDAAGGMVEALLFDEIAIAIMLNTSQHPNLMHPSFAFVWTQSLVNTLGLHHLLGRGENLSEHQLHEPVDGGKGRVTKDNIPVVLSHLNRYAVLQRSPGQPLIYCDSLRDALFVWSHVAEQSVRRRLQKLAYKIHSLQVPADDDDLIQRNSDVVQHILKRAELISAGVPQYLRQVFRIERDSVFFRATSDYVYWHYPGQGDDADSDSDSDSDTDCLWDSETLIKIMGERAPHLESLKNTNAIDNTRLETIDPGNDLWSISRLLTEHDDVMDL